MFSLKKKIAKFLYSNKSRSIEPLTDGSDDLNSAKGGNSRCDTPMILNLKSPNSTVWCRCASQQRVHSTPAVTNRISSLYAKASLHDKRIVNRMAARRQCEVVAAEHARIAHLNWALEESERDAMLHENKVVLSLMRQDMRERDIQSQRSRKASLRQLDVNRVAQIQRKLAAKDKQISERLQNLEMQRRIGERERRIRADGCLSVLSRLNAVHNLDGRLQQLETRADIEERLSQAEQKRIQQQEVLLKQIRAENAWKMYKHSQNFEVCNRIEKLRISELKTKIAKHAERLHDFREYKLQKISESRKRAYASTELRSFVRDVISPAPIDRGTHFFNNNNSSCHVFNKSHIQFI